MKKVLMLILSIVIVVSLFAGCSNVKTDEVIPETDEKIEVSDKENVKTENEETKEPEKDDKDNKKPANQQQEPVSGTNNSNSDNKKPDSDLNSSSQVESSPSSSVTPPVNDAPPVTSTPVETTKPTVKVEKTASEIAEKMVAVIPSGEHNLEKIPDELYKDIYGVDKSGFESVCIFGTMISVKANEIIVIKVKNESDVSKAVDILTTRKNQVYKTWEQYLPDQFEMVKKGVIKTNGKYAALIISPEVNKVANKFIELTK